ncbi:MAG: LPS export ABC transporter periplasmic protein LptC [Elusimicrobiota bacterium]
MRRGVRGVRPAGRGSAAGRLASNFLLLAAAFLAAPACRQPSSKAAADGADSASLPEQTIHGFTLEAFVDGRLDWRLSSPRADLFERENSVAVDKPTVRFFEDGRPGARMQAGRGRVDTESKDMWAWDDVVVVSTDGARLESDWMRYISASDRLVSTAPVTVVRAGSTARGVGWEASADLSEVVIHRQRVEIEGADWKPGSGK